MPVDAQARHRADHCQTAPEPGPCLWRRRFPQSYGWRHAHSHTQKHPVVPKHAKQHQRRHADLRSHGYLVRHLRKACVGHLLLLLCDHHTRDETQLAASPLSDVAVVTISKADRPLRRKTRGYAISCADETITVTESYEVYTAPDRRNKVESGGQITPARPITFAKTDRHAGPPSDWTAITVPPAPPPPDRRCRLSRMRPSKGRKDGKITIPAGMEYQAQSSTGFQTKLK